MILSKTKFIFLVQILINIIFAGYLTVNVEKNGLLFINIAILILIFIVNTFILNLKFQSILHWLNIIFLPAIYSYCLNLLANTLLKEYPAISLEIAIGYIILFLIFLLPIIINDFGQIKNGYARLFVAVEIILVLMLSDALKINDYISFLSDWSGSEIINGVALIITIFFIFKKWNIKLKINLNLFKIAEINYWLLFSLIIFGAWYTFFHNYIYIAPTFSQLFWNYDFSLIFPNVRATLWSLGAILFEEIYRWVLIGIILLAFKNNKMKIEITIFLSALLYGLSHYTNLLPGRMSVLDITSQVIFAFGYGCFLAVLYLYSGQIWLLFLSHFSLDFLALSLTGGGGGILSWYGNNNLLCGLLSAILPIVITLLMLFGKRKKVMLENANNLVNYK